MHARSRIDAPRSSDDLIDLHDLLEGGELFIRPLADSLLTEDVR